MSNGLPPLHDESRIADESLQYVCVVGSSAGGLPAMLKLFAQVPYDHMVFLIVQHLPTSHRSALADILRKNCALKVQEATNGILLAKNTVYVVPGGCAVDFKHDRITLHPQESSKLRAAAITRCMVSLADSYGQRALGVLLSGTGDDGSEGMRAIRAAGGVTYVQDPGEARHADMPQKAIDEGGADFCLSAEQIAVELANIPNKPRAQDTQAKVIPSTEQLHRIAESVLLHNQLDLREYKIGTLERRLRRRMEVAGVNDVEAYATLLKDSKEECLALVDDIYINVTRFFREPDVFQYLIKETFPKLIHGRKQGDALRVWCLGCSTGEEAYSLAIALQLAMEGSRSRIPIKIIASDADYTAIDIARKGIYHASILNDLPVGLADRFFVKRGTGLHVDPLLRRMVLFSHHDVLRDPPFANIDLISCRNMLIYLRPVAQRRCLSLLHYALSEHGYLLLGASESVSEVPHLFTPEHRDYNIYRKKHTASKAQIILPEYKQIAANSVTPVSAGSGIRDSRRATDATIIRRLGGPGVVVNEQLFVSEVRGDVRRYLGAGGGTSRFQLLRFAPIGMHNGLLEVVEQAGKSDDGLATINVECSIESSLRSVLLRALLIITPPGHERLYLILFADAEISAAADKLGGSARGGAPRGKDIEEQHYIQTLERELRAYRECLDQAIDDRERLVEDSKYLDQEAQAYQEELQSLVEELETSKEEVQCSNEELVVVNEELKNRMLEVEGSHAEMQDILQNVQCCMLSIDSHLRIRSFSQSAARLFSLEHSDIGRPLSVLNRYFCHCDLSYWVMWSLERQQQTFRDVEHVSRHMLEINISPMAARSADQQAGCLLMFTVSALNVPGMLNGGLNLVKPLFDTNWLMANYAVIILTDDLVGVWANFYFYRLMPGETESIVGKKLSSVEFGTIFTAKFHGILSEFAASSERVLPAELFADVKAMSLILKTIDVRKSTQREGEPKALRIICEEYIYD